MLTAWETIDSTASSLLSSQGEDGQTSFSKESFQISLDRVPALVHASDSGLYLSVPSSILPVLDTLLPAHLTPVAFSSSSCCDPNDNGKPVGRSGGEGSTPCPHHTAPAVRPQDCVHRVHHFGKGDPRRCSLPHWREGGQRHRVEALVPSRHPQSGPLGAPRNACAGHRLLMVSS
jgi:hypothetical protein